MKLARRMDHMKFFKSLSFREKVLTGIIAVLLVLLVIALLNSGGDSASADNGEVLATDDQQLFTEVEASIKTLIEIDEDEQVNIALVEATADLKRENPEFYTDLEVGHFVIVLPDSQRVLIFDRDSNQIINFSNYTLQVPLIPESSIPDSQKPLSIEIRYAKSSGDLDRQTFEDSLKSTSPSYDIIATTETSIDYHGITIVLLNQEEKGLISNNFIAHVGTNQVTTQIPEGELTTGADVLLLVGSI